MENNGNVICRARFKSSFFASLIIGLLVFAIPFMLLFISNRVAMGKVTSKYSDDDFSSVEYKKGIIELEAKNIGGENKYFLINKEGFKESGDNAVKKYFFGTSNGASGTLSVCFILLVAALGVTATVLTAGISQKCSLSLSKDQIEGQLKTTFGKKKLQMPIDHLDSVMTSNSLMDRIRGGNTILVSSNSGIIRFHYVQNAEEFAQAAMQRINEVKKSAPAAAQPAAPAPVQTVSGGDAMEKINSLKQMLDSGLITQEQFEQKRNDILSKM